MCKEEHYLHFVKKEQTQVLTNANNNDWLKFLLCHGYR